MKLLSQGGNCNNIDEKIEELVGTNPGGFLQSAERIVFLDKLSNIDKELKQSGTLTYWTSTKPQK